MKLSRFFIALIILCCSILSIALSPDNASATSNTIYGISGDGYMSATDATYATAQADSGDFANSGGATLIVGQNIGFTIYRGALFFDTSGIPDSATIDSVALYLYGSADVSTTDFDLTVVSGGTLGTPLVAAHYGSLLSEVSDLGHISTSGFVTDDYNVITLNAAGLSEINKTDYTKLGLRSSEDIGASEPTTAEYVNIYTQERGFGYEPKLIIEYSIPALATPDIIEISNVAIFTGYMETGDQLYVFTPNLKYSSTPDFLPSEYYVVQLYADSNLKAQVPVKRWGFSPLSIYLSADSALAQDDNYTLVLVGSSDKFVTSPSFSYSIISSDWKGSAVDSDIFKQWIYTVGNKMGLEDGIGVLGYRDSSDGSLLNNTATMIFFDAIPYINSLYYNLFSKIGEPSQQDEIIVPDNQSGAYYNTWGSYWVTAWDGLGNSVGLPGYVVVSLLFFVASVIIVIILSRKVSSPLVYLAVIPTMLLGCMVGMPLWIALIAGAFAGLYFGFNVLARGLG